MYHDFTLNPKQNYVYNLHVTNQQYISISQQTCSMKKLNARHVTEQLPIKSMPFKYYNVHKHHILKTVDFKSTDAIGTKCEITI
jgi:hypothetical protein